MGANLTQYRGWDINATYYSGGNGYLPTVMITKHTATNAIDKQLMPPSDNGFRTENEAYTCGMDYAKAVIDGRVSGIDVSAL